MICGGIFVKKILLTGFLSITMLLSSCSALLNRSYSHVTPHNTPKANAPISASRQEPDGGVSLP